MKKICHKLVQSFTCRLLWWFFLASFNCSAPQCFVLIGSIYVTIFRGGLVGRQAGWLEEIPRIPNTAHHWETLHSGKKHWKTVHWKTNTEKYCTLWNTAYCALQFTGLWYLLNHWVTWWHIKHNILQNWTQRRSKNIQKVDGTVLQSEAVWSSL